MPVYLWIHATIGPIMVPELTLHNYEYWHTALFRALDVLEITPHIRTNVPWPQDSDKQRARAIASYQAWSIVATTSSEVVDYLKPFGYDPLVRNAKGLYGVIQRAFSQTNDVAAAEMSSRYPQ